MEIWTTESNKSKPAIMSLGCLAAGVLIMYFSYHYAGPNDDNAWAGLMLGVLLTLVGLYAFIDGRKQIITVDPNYRQIIVVTIGRFRTKKRIFLFDEIEDIAIGYIGKKSNFVHFYYLVLKLKDGKEGSLFSPGYFDNGTNREIVEGWRNRLLQYIQNQQFQC
jgi:hypothetical protein